ncbi:MAG: DUF6384 family protein [Pseudomonadota bacterium]
MSASTTTAAATKAIGPRQDAEFDDVMLAMDVVDTLRYRDRIVESELGAEAREAALIDRLRVIYKNQGIDVPDRILRDGVKALEEKRFVYEPPADGFAIRLAKAYVNRGRWGRPVMLILGLAAFVAGVYQFGIAGPQAAAERAAAVEIAETLPGALVERRDDALALADTDAARTLIETYYQDGVAAVAAGDRDAARANVEALSNAAIDLGRELTIRIVSRPGEMSGVFRVHDDSPGVRNYYLIVEAIDARGAAQAMTIVGEEDQSRRRVDKWGVRVDEGVFNRIAADKQDDQIIQNAVIGAKPRGALSPAYEIETLGGTILDW